MLYLWELKFYRLCREAWEGLIIGLASIDFTLLCSKLYYEIFGELFFTKSQLFILSIYEGNFFID
jgi:hypothetical protein